MGDKTLSKNIHRSTNLHVCLLYFAYYDTQAWYLTGKSQKVAEKRAKIGFLDNISTLTHTICLKLQIVIDFTLCRKIFYYHGY